MNKAWMFEELDYHKRLIPLTVLPLLVLLVIGVALLVYTTGGIKYVYSHSMYLPIVLAGLVFGFKGGILVGVVGGLVLGPMMPIEVASGEMQATKNWLYRTGFFALIGFLSGVASDAARAYLKHLKWLAERDSESGLPNRQALFRHLSELSRVKNDGDALFLAVISFENLVELKSSFGYGVIAKAVVQIDQKLRQRIEDREVYRTAPEQLAVLIKADEHKLNSVLYSLAEDLQEPLKYENISVHLDTRMGCVQLGELSEQSETYLQRAETALIVAQEKVQDSVVYSPEILSATRENVSLLGELKKALRSGEVSMHYQPKIHIPTSQVHSVEALMRWQHPTRGNIPPGDFIPRAEQSTLINTITEFALDQSLQQQLAWQEQGIHLPVAVNISTRNLLQPGFSDKVLELLNKYGLKGENLELEVTEGALMMDMQRTLDELAKLDDLKIIISIDDFGTGYSSLQYLHSLPISLLKIDQCFVRRLPGDEGAAHILEAAITLAHKMGIRAIAEGVETLEVYDFLADLGCDFAQGYLMSRPLPAKHFTSWYQQCNGRYACWGGL
ncbi:putative bifunctional diguanylate cyclase/phosphodiesterase [Marinospirillum sp.]|uniref:putative bifunctional diguanylate cyclase/phosphodiesterase n=1 Tax=Marinospirillum sp. TaxID=2183934 RepID=UPI00384E0307